MKTVSNQMIAALCCMLILAIALMGTLIIMLAPVIIHPDPLAPGDTDFDRASAMVMVVFALSVVMMPIIFSIERGGRTEPRL